MIDLIKKLRQQTGASIAECQKALKETGGDYEKAEEWLRKNSALRADKKSNRTTAEGIIASYIHNNNKIGAMIEILCETDFVARNPEFKELGQELAMQIAAMSPENGEEPTSKWLLKQPYIREQNVTIENLLKEKVSKLGENIKIRNVARFEI